MPISNAIFKESLKFLAGYQNLLLKKWSLERYFWKNKEGCLKKLSFYSLKGRCHVPLPKLKLIRELPDLLGEKILTSKFKENNTLDFPSSFIIQLEDLSRASAAEVYVEKEEKNFKFQSKSSFEAKIKEKFKNFNLLNSLNLNSLFLPDPLKAKQWSVRWILPKLGACQKDNKKLNFFNQGSLYYLYYSNKDKKISLLKMEDEFAAGKLRLMEIRELIKFILNHLKPFS